MAYLFAGLFGERSLTKVAGLYPQKARPESSMAAVMRLAASSQARCGWALHDAGHRTVKFFPRDGPEPQGIARTFYQTHLVGGMAGAAAGLACNACGSRAQGTYHDRQQPAAGVDRTGRLWHHVWFAGGRAAVDAAGIIRLITRVRSALRHDHWAVVAHPTTPVKRPRSRPAAWQRRRGGVHPVEPRVGGNASEHKVGLQRPHRLRTARGK